MDILIRQAQIIDPASAYHQQLTDIHIKDGVIVSIGNGLTLPEGCTEFDRPGLTVSPGWLDPFAHFCDPGYEQKETLETGAAAAAAGGFTDVFTLPNTNPPVHHKAAVEYLVQGSKPLPAAIHPIGAVTKNIEGKELAEMYDMRHSGAQVFGDGTASIQSPGLMLKALLYLKAIDAVLIQLPDDRSISANGLMNESVHATRLGLAGKPAIAEELMINRDIELAAYTGSKVHFTGVSTARGLELIRKAKAAGIQVSCSVTPYHLYFTEADLESYDTNLKVNPPLRSAADRDALRKGVVDGTIDCIASHHQPHEKDSKVVEFEYARNGMSSLETAFAVVATALPELDAASLAHLFAVRSRAVFGMQAPVIKEGGQACITLFSTGTSWQVDKNRFRSRNNNAPLDGTTLNARVWGTINKGIVTINK